MTGLLVSASVLGATTVVLSQNVGGTIVAYADETGNTETSKNVVADKTSTRSITLHKYEVKDLSEVGERGTGSKEEVDKKPLPGIKFKAIRVKALPGKSLTNGKTAKEGVDYEVDGTFEAVTLTTDDKGEAVLDLGKGTANDGIYLVTELADDREGENVSHAMTPVDPFFVYVPQTNREDLGSLIYDVNVYPKNILKTLLDPNKTVEGGEGFSIKAGEKFNWELEANLPAGLFQTASHDMVIDIYDESGKIVEQREVKKGDPIYGQYYRIKDTLVKDLKLDSIVVQGKTADGEWTDMTADNYKATVDGEEATSSTTEKEKKVEVSLTENGMKHVTDEKYTQIRVVVTTHSEKDFNGVISNDFEVEYLMPGQPPVSPVHPPVQPEYYTGGFDIEKTAEDTKKVLAGAEFYISASKEEADKGIYIAENGKSYGEGSVEVAEAAAQAAGTTLLKATTNDKGFAEFNGLALNWFNDSNANGKQDENEPSLTKEDINRSYWLVETKSPAGYELLKTPVEIKVDLSTENNEKIEATIVGKPKTELPFTGGQGTTLMVAVAMGAIVMGTAIVIIDKKRRAQ